MHSWQDNDYSGNRAIEELNEYQRRRQSGEIYAIGTGIDPIDRHLDMEVGNLVILAARPKQGKTATAISMFCSQIVNRIARPAFFSLEMAKLQITMRMIANVPYKVIKNGDYGSHSTRAKADNARKIMREYPMQLCGDRSLSVDAIVDRVGQMVAQAGSNIIYIDQLSFVKAIGKNDLERFDSVVRDLKEFAEAAQVVIVLLCQVNREGEKSGGGPAKPPRMEHLKGCGGIEETADIILVPWYPNSQDDCPTIMYGGKNVNVVDKIILRCVADRSGDKWAEMLAFDGATSCINKVRV